VQLVEGVVYKAKGKMRTEVGPWLTLTRELSVATLWQTAAE